jgi:hypothetical protein
MRTANGTTKADLASIGELRVGNIVAHDRTRRWLALAAPMCWA